MLSSLTLANCNKVPDLCLPLRSGNDAQDHGKAGNGKEALHIGNITRFFKGSPKSLVADEYVGLSRAYAPGVESLVYLESQKTGNERRG